MLMGTEKYNRTEAITLYMRGAVGFLNHVQELASNWHAPISVAIFLNPEEEDMFLYNLGSVRNCGVKSEAVKRFVDFHIYYNSNWKPNSTIWRDKIVQHNQSSCGGSK